jgi:hypothetical protein
VRSAPALISDEAVPLVDVDVDEHPVEPAPAPATALLGGVTIKRRRRGVPAPDIAETAPPDPGPTPAAAAAGEPVTLPVSPQPPEPATAPELGQRELVEPEAVASADNADGAVDGGEVAPPDPGARRLAPMRRTLAGPGASPLLDSLEEDRKRLQRARDRRND